MTNRTDIFFNPDAMIVSSAVMEAIPAMVAVLDSNLNYIYANQKYVDIVNSPRPSWKGLTLFEYLPEYLHDNVRPRVERAARGEAISYYLEFFPADGIPRTILVSYHRMRAEPDSGPSGTGPFVMTGVDATDLKVAERRLYEAQKFETIGHLTGGIAHDFNNNIAAILGIFALLRNAISNDQMLDWIDKGVGAADQCSKLTSQLLTFARRQTIQPRALKVKDSANAVIGLLRISMPGSIELTFEDQTPDSAVYADPTQFEGAIINLIFNARDAMPKGGHIRIGTSLARSHNGRWFKVGSAHAEAGEVPADFVLIEVSDDGIGMTKDVARLAFEPFFTTKDRGRGSGMGLAMVEGFARQSGGTVELNTAQGRGTTVRLYLPRAECAGNYRNKSVIKHPVTSVKLSVLVVEDEDDVAFVFCEMLQAMGHSTVTCKTAQDALAILEATAGIDVVLTDIVIEGAMTGLDLREHILSLHPKVRVICTSGYQNYRSGGLIGPDVEFLPKPFSFEELAKRMVDGDTIERPAR